MSKRKAAAETTAEPLPENAQSAGETTTAIEPEPVTATEQPQTQAPVQAPAKGEGRAYTIDNRLGYRKEDSPDGRRRQIRFTDRPDDEVLVPVREKKPEVSWSAKEKAWQSRKTPESLEALDYADQELAEIGRKRTGGQER